MSEELGKKFGNVELQTNSKLLPPDDSDQHLYPGGDAIEFLSRDLKVISTSNSGFSQQRYYSDSFYFDNKTTKLHDYEQQKKIVVYTNLKA